MIHLFTILWQYVSDSQNNLFYAVSICCFIASTVVYPCLSSCQIIGFKTASVRFDPESDILSVLNSFKQRSTYDYPCLQKITVNTLSYQFNVKKIPVYFSQFTSSRLNILLAHGSK